MSTESQAVDQVLNIGLKLTDVSVDLFAKAASGSIKLAAFTAALAENDKVLTGKTTVKKLFAEGGPTAMLPIKAEDLKQFEKLTKDIGMPFAQIKTKGSDTVELVVRAGDVPRIEAIMQKIGYINQQREAKAETRRAKREELIGGLTDKGEKLLEAVDVGKNKVKNVFQSVTSEITNTIGSQLKKLSKPEPIKEPVNISEVKENGETKMAFFHTEKDARTMEYLFRRLDIQNPERKNSHGRESVSEKNSHGQSRGLTKETSESIVDRLAAIKERASQGQKSSPAKAPNMKHAVTR